MKKNWKDIEGQLVRIDIGSTFEQAQSDSTDAAVICFTTDGHIVLNGVNYMFDAYEFKQAAQTNDWVRKYIQQGDDDHPFLQGRLTEDTYNIGWMKDGFTYKESVDIPLISEEQQGLVDSQSYADYIQPLLKGEYDERIDAVEATADAAKEKADANASAIEGKVDNDDTYKNVKASAEWSQNYVMTDRTNVGKPFLQYQFDTDNKTLNIGWLTAVGYAYTVKIPLVDDTHNAFFDPYYYSEVIQPLLNGEFAFQSDLDNVEATANANASAIKELEPTVSWLLKNIMQGDTEYPFLEGHYTEDTYNIGWMLDGWIYRENVKIPLLSEFNRGLVDEQSYEDYLQPLLKGEYDERIDANASAIEELKKSGGSSSYTLPMATKDVLGGVKVSGDVRASADSLPLEGAALSRELDGTILMPYAYASKRGADYDHGGAMTKAQVRKLYEIEAKAQVNKIESIKVNGVAVSVDSDKCANIIVSGGSGSDTEAINALNAKVEQMQQEIDELKKLLMMA